MLYVFYCDRRKLKLMFSGKKQSIKIKIEVIKINLKSLFGITLNFRSKILRVLLTSGLFKHPKFSHYSFKNLPFKVLKECPGGTR